MNVIAGILIGWFSDTWTQRLIIPFVWGAVFVLWRVGSALVGVGTAQAEVVQMRDGLARIGNSTRPILSFCRIEYTPGALTALLFAVISGALVSWLT